VEDLGKESMRNGRSPWPPCAEVYTIQFERLFLLKIIQTCVLKLQNDLKKSSNLHPKRMAKEISFG
jgi:hypothetical protein